MGSDSQGAAPTVFSQAYDTMTGTTTGPSITVPAAGANIMVLNRQKTEAFLGMTGTAFGPAAYTFQEISRVNIQGIPTSLGAPTPVISLDSDCYDMDAHPVTGHLIAACYGKFSQGAYAYEIIDVDPVLSTKVHYPLAPYNYFAGTLRIEPTQGNFAYLTGAFGANGQPAPKILSISFAGGSISFNGEITTPALRPLGEPSQVAFHPSGEWAYVPMFSSPYSVVVLDTNLGLQPATTVSTTKTYFFSPNQALYQVIASKDRLYVVGTTFDGNNSAYFMNVFDIDAQGALALNSSPPISYSGTPRPNGIARIEEAQSLIIAKVDPAVGPPAAVSLNNLPAAQSTSQVVPGGTSLPIDAGNQLQPLNAPTTGPQYSFLGWTKNAPCGSPFWPLAPNTDPVPQGQTDTYCACYEKQWFVSLNVLGSCSATALNGIPVSNGGGIWIKDGTTVTGSGTGGTVTVTPATGVMADGPLKSITVKCDPIAGPCSPAGSRPSLVGWWAFEGTAPTHDDRRGVDNYLDPGTSTRGTGHVNQAAFFATVPINSNASARTTDAAAEVNPATTVAFGNRSMSIDFWIKATPIANSGTRPVVDKMTGVGSSPSTGYKVDLVNNKVVYTLSSASTAAVWTSTNDAATGVWVHVAITTTGSSVPIIYLNGVPETLQAPVAAMITGSISNTAPLRIGSTSMIIPASTTLETQFELDELELFSGFLTRVQVEALAVSTVGKCVPAPGGNFPVTVNTNLNPLQGVTVGISNIGSGPDTYSNPSVPAGNQQVFAPATKIDNSNANIQWTLINWSFNGVPNPSWTNATQTVPVSSPGGTYTANYQAWYKLNVVIDGGCESNLATGFYPFPQPLVISVSGAGVSIIGYQGPTPSGGAAAPPIDSVANNTALPINFPGGTVTITCGAVVPVTVNTNPANINATVGVLTLGTATNVYTNPNVPNGSANISTTTPMTNGNQDTEWRFKNWSINNVVQPGLLTASPQLVSVPNTAVTFTANYDTWFKLTVNITGPCAVSNQTGFILSGTSFNFGVFATGGTINSITAVRPNNLSTNLPINGGNNSSSSPINMTSPLTINVVCSGPAISVTVNTNPANLGVTVGIAGGTTLNVHNATLPPSSAQTVTNTPTSVVANGTFYTFANWSPSGPSVTLSLTGGTTYTANYNLAGYVVTATGCGVTLSGAAPLQSNPLVYSSGTSLTVTANPSLGQSFASFQISVGGNNSTVATNPTTISVSGPVTIAATCNTSTTTTGGFDSNPSGFRMRVGSTGDFLATPFTRTVTLNQPLTVAAQTPQVRAGTGYEFANWSNGAANATTTFTPTAAPVRMTANYRIACHVVTATVSPANGGTISANARSLTGFPDGCYTPGARVTFAVSPAAGQVVTRWTGVEATGNSVTVTVSGPLTITAFTGPAPAPRLAF